MSDTPNLGLTKLEVGQAQKEATINENYDILDSASSGNASGAIWARVYHSATQSLTNATPALVSFNSEAFDTNAIHDNSTNNTRLTCKTAGVYLITATIAYAANATGERSTLIQLGGTTLLAGVLTLGSPTNPTRHSLSTIYPLTVNQYVEILAFQSSGGALNTDLSSGFTPTFMMVRLGA